MALAIAVPESSPGAGDNVTITVPDDLVGYICTASKVLAVPFIATSLGLTGTQAEGVVDFIRAQCTTPPPGPLSVLGQPGWLGLPWAFWGLAGGGVVLWLVLRK